MVEKRRLVLLGSILSGILIFSFIVFLGLLMESGFTLYHLNSMALEKGDEIRRNYLEKVEVVRALIGLRDVDKAFPNLTRGISAILLRDEEVFSNDGAPFMAPEKVILSIISLDSVLTLLLEEIEKTGMRERREFQELMGKLTGIEGRHLVLKREFLALSTRYNRKGEGLSARIVKTILHLPDYLPSGDF